LSCGKITPVNSNRTRARPTALQENPLQPTYIKRVTEPPHYGWVIYDGLRIGSPPLDQSVVRCSVQAGFLDRLH
jgi:hypothetical protein